MMNKKLLIGGVVVLLLLVFGAGYMFMNQSKPSTQSPSSAMMGTQPQTQTKTATKSLKDLIGLGSTQQCTFEDNEGQNKGTMYIASGKARIDSEAVNNGTTIVTHMISDGTNMYVWFDGAKQGMKTSIESVEEAKESIPGVKAEQKSVDINKQVDYSCNSWSVDNTMFTPPTTIEFVDYSKMTGDAMMPKTTGTGDGDAPASACSGCDNLPAGDARNQCRLALNCN